MNKFFNTAGLCNPGRHYMIDPLKRINDIEKLVNNELYFVIHTPVRPGKQHIYMR
jgi:hypothetical protein